MTTQIKLASIESTALNTLQGPRITSVQVDVDSGYTSSTANAVGLSGGYISINGSGFVTGCSVIIGSLTATSVSFVSSIKVNCQIPAQSAGTYTIYLINPDGSTAIRVNSVQYSSTPTWSTSGTQSGINPISLQLSASSDTTVSYSLQAGSSLPSGMTLTSGGLLSGSVTGSGTTTYNFTIVATDVELQYTPQAFSVTISFTEPYFYLTTVAINADNNSTGTVLTDASSNAFEITVAATPRASNFTPFGTGWSNYFNGSSDFLTIASDAAYNLNGVDWTIECWFYAPTTPPATATNIIQSYQGTNSWHPYVGIGLNTNLTFFIAINAVAASTTQTFTLNTWNHVALVRSSGVVTFYLNGAATSRTITADIASTNLSWFIGKFDNVQGGGGIVYYFNGYISNVRIVKGTAVYTGAFTPPTTVLATTQSSGTNIAAISTGTSLLTCKSNRFIDNSTNAFAITVSGSPTIQSFNPFNLSNTGSNGAMYFNGTTDSLLVAHNSLLDFSSGGGTIEFWAYPLDKTTLQEVYTKGTGIQVYINASSWYVAFSSTNSGSYFINASFGTVIPNAWQHIAITYNGSNYYAYVNGQQTSLGASASVPSTGTDVLYIGKYHAGYFYTGYISNVRFVKNIAVYTGAFTPPAVALATTQSAGTNIAAISTGTNLLTLQNKYSHNTTQGHQDSSTNQLLITSAGSPAAGNFSPFSQTGWSTYFNGSADYLQLPTTFIGAMGSGTSSNYTVECWVYLNVLPTGATYSTVLPILTAGTIWEMWSIANNGYFFGDRAGSYVSATGTIPTVATWSHLAFVNSGTSMTVYLNGTSVATCSLTGTWVTSQLGLIGHNGYAYFNGYISNLRVTTTVVYTGTFTPSTTPLTAVAGTILLTCQSNRFVDKSASPYALTPSGSTSIQAFSPLAPTAAYSVNTVGGSVYTGTTSDWINVANSNSLKLSTSNFTIECWIYFINPNSQTYYGIVGKRTADASVGYLLFGLNSSFGLLLLASSNGSGWDISNTSGSTALKKNAWYHVALVRSGSSIKAYLNGALEITVTSSAAIYDNTAALSIGNWSETQSSYPFIGYISNFRFQIGTAQYTTTFATPTSLVTTTANTNVMVDSTSTALTDVSSRYNLITTSLAKISTAVSKFGTGSMYFGTGNYITAPSSVLAAWGTGDFTIETWIYLTSLAADTCIIDGRDGTGTAVKPCFFVQSSSSNFIFYVNGGIRIQGGTYSLSTWQHVAVCRSSGSTKMFVAGTQAGSTYTDANSYLACALRIGYFNDGSTTNSFNGYMDDLRITRYARYTTTFTPPTVTFIAR